MCLNICWNTIPRGLELWIQEISSCGCQLPDDHQYEYSTGNTQPLKTNGLSKLVDTLKPVSALHRECNTCMNKNTLSTVQTSGVYKPWGTKHSDNKPWGTKQCAKKNRKCPLQCAKKNRRCPLQRNYVSSALSSDQIRWSCQRRRNTDDQPMPA
jgi:hypothetical protein